MFFLRNTRAISGSNHYITRINSGTGTPVSKHDEVKVAYAK